MPCVADVDGSVGADVAVFALFEGLDDGVDIWADRLRFKFSLFLSPMTFALAALDSTTNARFWEWCAAQLARLERRWKAKHASQ